MDYKQKRGQITMPDITKDELDRIAAIKSRIRRANSPDDDVSAFETGDAEWLITGLESTLQQLNVALSAVEKLTDELIPELKTERDRLRERVTALEAQRDAFMFISERCGAIATDDGSLSDWPEKEHAAAMQAVQRLRDERDVLQARFDQWKKHALDANEHCIEEMKKRESLEAEVERLKAERTETQKQLSDWMDIERTLQAENERLRKDFVHLQFTLIRAAAASKLDAAVLLESALREIDAALAESPATTCPICGASEFVDPLPGTTGRRCVKCCDVAESPAKE
jgi:DNA repair exonuclease SbcCD ATPase subunit